MQDKHPTIRPLLNHHRYQHQEEQAKHSHKIIRHTTKLSPTHLMESYLPPTFKPEDIIDQVHNHFKEELIKMLDAVAPQKTLKQQKNPGSTNTLDNGAR